MIKQAVFKPNDVLKITLLKKMLKERKKSLNQLNIEKCFKLE